MLLDLAQRSDLSIEQTFQVAQSLYQSGPSGSKERRQAIQMFLHFAQQPDLSAVQAYKVVQALEKSSPRESEEQQLVTQLFLHIDHLLSIEETIQAIRDLYPPGPQVPEERRLANQMLSHFAQHFDHSLTRSIEWVDEVRPAIQILLRFVQQVDLSLDQVVQASVILYRYSLLGSEEERLTIQMLLCLAQNQDVTIERRLQAAAILLIRRADYSVRAQAVRLVLALLQREEAKRYFEEHWQSGTTDEPLRRRAQEAVISDIPYIVELAQQELLPTTARDEMYQILRDMVPQFDKIPRPTTNPPHDL